MDTDITVTVSPSVPLPNTDAAQLAALLDELGKQIKYWNEYANMQKGLGNTSIAVLVDSLVSELVDVLARTAAGHTANPV
jgi:hypothetical protein